MKRPLKKAGLNNLFLGERKNNKKKTNKKNTFFFPFLSLISDSMHLKKRNFFFSFLRSFLFLFPKYLCSQRLTPLVLHRERERRESCFTCGCRIINPFLIMRKQRSSFCFVIPPPGLKAAMLLPKRVVNFGLHSGSWNPLGLGERGKGNKATVEKEESSLTQLLCIPPVFLGNNNASLSLSLLLVYGCV